MEEKVFLTVEEKEHLEDYKGENPFLKSLSEKYCEYGDLTQRQIIAYRNTNKPKSEELEKCLITGLKINQICNFIHPTSIKLISQDPDFNIVITKIRPKALCINVFGGNHYAWIPAKAIIVSGSVDVNTDEETTSINLENWFTVTDEFWKLINK